MIVFFKTFKPRRLAMVDCMRDIHDMGLEILEEIRMSNKK